VENIDGNLANLHDIVMPPPVPWWPPAPGWYVLAVVVGALVIAIVWRARRRWLARRYRTQALTELRAIHLDSLEPADAAASMMTVLKRTALAAYPRQQVAGLSGVDWWSFLDQSVGGNEFSESLGPMTNVLVYSDAPNDETSVAVIEQLAVASERWVRNHPSFEPHGQD
jgi:hypothetical protein